jgi:predicted nucleotidyltransferase
MDANVIQKVREYLSTQPVMKAWVFGSFSRGEQTPSSDVDIIVVFDEKADVSLIGYIRIQYELETIFGRKVDLVEEGSLLPFAVESANRDRKLIYERAS